MGKKVAIIGAGFTGLTAGLRLAKRGFDVTIFEKSELPGGLAVGFKDKDWKWSLEQHYHHIFTSDIDIQNLADEVGVGMIFKRPITSIILKSKIFQLDSPISLLLFPYLSVVDRVRTGLVLFYLKVLPFWKTLEGIKAVDFLVSFMGKRSWEVLWEPLFRGKFGKYAYTIPASWFWARIKKRSASLGYPVGGFENLAQKIAEQVEKHHGKIIYKTEVVSIEKDNFFIVKSGQDTYEFDRVISTLPSPLFVKTVPGLPKGYSDGLLNLKGIGAVNLILALKNRFLTDGTYWLNINENDLPFLAVVEHTNFMNSKNYGGDNLLYVGNYLSPDHKFFTMDSQELVKIFAPYLQKINPEFNLSWVRNSWVFKAPFAQPLIPLNYSKILPGIKTPMEGLYLANIQQVYPWDRGTNYAVQLGNKVAKMINGG